MYCKKECIAMLLAGGQGARLYELTETTAKPAVTFGGKYKIIDFPLSNCINSAIDTVGVLTQYQPLVLNEYVGSGAPWDLDRMRGGLSLLPPYRDKGCSDWYVGTANAIYQNLNYIRQYDPDYTLILSGDHVYRMDYAKMLESHKRNSAVCTIATVNVDISEASRFGICNADESGRIYEFEEKPQSPKSTRASMGIYVFNTSTLIKYLELDDKCEESQKDFGKNIIPALISNGEPVFAYDFYGYWKDVGTVGSLWECNMDLLKDNAGFSLRGGEGRILSRNSARPPQFHGSGAKVSGSLVSEGCRIYGHVEGSVLSGGVVVESEAVVKDTVIMDDVRICKGARVFTAIIDSGAVIEGGAVVGVENGGRDQVTIVSRGSVVRRGE